MAVYTIPRTATKRPERPQVYCLQRDDIDLVIEALRMMSQTLQDASVQMSRIMPEALILERFADWREHADRLRARLERA